MNWAEVNELLTAAETGTSGVGLGVAGLIQRPVGAPGGRRAVFRLSARSATPAFSFPHAPDAQTSGPETSSRCSRDLTRAEFWRFFEPPPGGGVEPDYFFIGNRSTLGVNYDGRHWSMRGAIQYVRLENLPRGAIGPGLLGNGGAYYFQAAGTFSYQFYFRALSAAFTSEGRGVSVEAGRLSFTAKEAASPADPTAALDRARLDGRLLDDMDGSLYQRAWDGVRVQFRRGDWRWTAAAVLPTQGTFEESANLPLDRVRVVTADLAVAPGAIADHTRIRGFAVRLPRHPRRARTARQQRRDGPGR